MCKKTRGMRKIGLFLCILLLLSGLSGCGSRATEGDCECVVELTEVPREMEMLSENLQKQFRVSVVMENIYTEKSVSIELLIKDGFKGTLKLKPGTYRVRYSSVNPTNLIPLEIKEKTETVEVLRDKEAKLQFEVTNPEEVADWIWNQQAGRQVLQEDAFSHWIQFQGQMIDLKEITDYVDIEYDKEIAAYEKKTLSGDKGVTITVQNESGEPAKWQDCTLRMVNFHKSNVIWGQGAYVGMPIKEAVHAEEGLYGVPTEMSGTVLAGTGYDYTDVSWLDEKSGDKLTLRINPAGSYISMICYEFEVFE